MKRIIASLLLACLFSSPVHADIDLRYLPSSALKLGANGLPSLPNTAFEECIVSDGVVVDSLLTGADQEFPTSVESVSITSNFVTDYDELLADLDVETSGKIEGAFTDALSGNIEAEFDLNITNKKTSDIAAYILTAKYNFGSRSLKNPRLKQDILDLVEAEKIDEARSRCGTHFARTESRVAFVKIIISTSSITKDLSTDLRHKLVAKGSLGPLKGDASSEIKAVMESIKRYGDTEISVFARGGNPALVAPLIAKANQQDVDKIIPDIEKYVASFNFKNSVANSVQLAQIRSLAEKESRSQDQLAFLRNAYVQVRNLRKAIENVKSSILYQQLQGNVSGSLISSLDYKQISLSTKLDELEGAVEKCLTNSLYCQSHLNSDGSSWSPTKIIGKSLRWNCLKNPTGDGTTRIDLISDIQFENLQLINSIEVYRQNGFSDPIEIAKSNWKNSSDPRSGRVAFRLETVSVKKDSNDELSYDAEVVSKDGIRQWYHLGSVSTKLCK